MHARVSSCLLLTTCLILSQAGPAAAQHKLGEGNAHVPGDVLSLWGMNEPGRGKIVIKKPAHVRIIQRTGAVVATSDAIVTISDWDPEFDATLSDVPRGEKVKVTLTSEDPDRRGTRSQVSTLFMPGATITQDVVVKLTQKKVDGYRELCRTYRPEHRTEKHGLLTGLSSVAIDTMLTYKVSSSVRVDEGTFWFKDHRNRGRRSRFLRVAVRFECVLPAQGAAVSPKSKVHPTNKPVSPTKKTPTRKRPTPVNTTPHRRH